MVKKLTLINKPLNSDLTIIRVNFGTWRNYFFFKAAVYYQDRKNYLDKFMTSCQVMSEMVSICVVSF